jgi:hypothetical protein
VSKSELCVGCGKQSPVVESDHTLISTRFGWRLTRKVSPEGALILEWRCPSCWSAYKRGQPEVATAPAEPTAAFDGIGSGAQTLR